MKVLPAVLDDPAWLHGASAFSTVRTRQGTALNWPAHWARLAGTCVVLGLPAPETELPALEAFAWGLLRVTVTAGGTFALHRPLTPGPRPTAGVRVVLTDIQPHPQLAAHKTGNYFPYRLAAQQATAAGAFEGWLMDTAGHVVDGSRTSPVLEIAGRLVLPLGGLPGLTRAAFLDGQKYETGLVSAAELTEVTRAWICGAGVGIVPVQEISGPGLRLGLPVQWPETEDWGLVWPG
ncbi:aminotransferase class IV [Deinococcus sp. Arct2-2]|uniref:aminotransferase class IV n=1 Tax=Deinococcus sp. Arct2-2 TaxID=2568653 RepID=UPI0010A56F51|nr:aminotransferase class IV [Deinococcus sp. Arct2-2]THF68444.1 aminotransferase class IV [Deinococcus sp. Arct2-2]